MCADAHAVVRCANANTVVIHVLMLADLMAALIAGVVLAVLLLIPIAFFAVLEYRHKQ